MYKKIAMLILLISMSFAQEKIGAVFSERIFANFSEYKDVEEQLQLDLQAIQFEFDKMAVELDSMLQEYDKQSLMMSEELKKAKEQDIVDMQNSMQSYQLSKVGPEGELTRKQAALEYDLNMKVQKAIETVAINKGFDIILEGSGAVRYTKGAYDLTDDVLFQLNNSKTTGSTE